LKRWFASKGNVAPDGYEPPHWWSAYIVARHMRIPPWEVEQAPIEWVSRILAGMEAENLAAEWNWGQKKQDSSSNRRRR